MTYLLLTMPFLTVSLLVAIIGVVTVSKTHTRGSASLAPTEAEPTSTARTLAPPPSTRQHVAAVGMTLAALGVLTAAFDSLMIAANLFHYDESQLMGLFVGLAPLEDFSYPVATALLLPGLWVFFTKRSPNTLSDSVSGVTTQP